MLGAIRSLLDDARLEGLEAVLGRALNDDAGMGKVGFISLSWFDSR